MFLLLFKLFLKKVIQFGKNSYLCTQNNTSTQFFKLDASVNKRYCECYVKIGYISENIKIQIMKISSQKTTVQNDCNEI